MAVEAGMGTNSSNVAPESSVPPFAPGGCSLELLDNSNPKQICVEGAGCLALAGTRTYEGNEASLFVVCPDCPDADETR